MIGALKRLVAPNHTRDDFRPNRVSPSQEAPPQLSSDAIPEAFYDLLQSPSIFGRLLLVAGLRFTATGRDNAGPSAPVHTPPSDDALRKLHLEIFVTWLSLPLERQKADISIYLNLRAGGDRSAKSRQLVASAEASIPATAKPAERQLFLQNLKIVQMLFNYDY